MITRIAILLIVLLPASVLRSQSIMASIESGAGGKLFPWDAAVLELREVNTSLPCAVSPGRTELGFDLVFHAGQITRIRLRDLAGEGDVLTSIFRVTSESKPTDPVYFEQKWRVPPIPESAGGEILLESSFVVGEGDYHVDWLLRDRQERVCSAFWKVSARMPTKAGQIAAGLPLGAIGAAGADSYIGHEASRIEPGERLSLTILLNVSPDVTGGANISHAESETLLSILRGIVGEPRIGEISITAFNLDQRQVIFEQEDIRQVNFATLKKAIGSLTLGTVSVNQLAEKDGEARFLIRLAQEKTGRKRASALIFLGRKALDDFGMNRDLLKQFGDARCPVFYLTYTPAPEANPWHDMIGLAVRHWRGREFTISKPTDLITAWSKIMSQLGGVDWRAPEE